MQQQTWSKLKIVSSRHLSVAGALVGSVYRDISKQEPHSLGLSFPNSPQHKHQHEAVDEGLTTGSTQTSALAEQRILCYLIGGPIGQLGILQVPDAEALISFQIQQIFCASASYPPQSEAVPFGMGVMQDALIKIRAGKQ